MHNSGSLQRNVETSFSRSDARSMLRAKAWRAVRVATESRLSGGPSPEELPRLAQEAAQLAETALASLAPRAIEDPRAIGWQVPDCRPGCHFCCYEQVNVTPPEVFSLADHIRANWSEGRIRSLRKKLTAAASLSRDLDHEAYFAARIRCPLLDSEDRCSVYAVRPLMCRAYNSLDVAACERAAKNPSKPAHQRGVRTNGTIHGIMDGAFGGLKEALGKSGRQEFLPNLVVALHQALDNPELQRHWLAGKQVFQ